MKQTEKGFLASSVCRHDVGLQAPMNGSTVSDGKHHLFAGGLDDECHLFSLKYKIITPTKTGTSLTKHFIYFLGGVLF